MTPFFDPAQGSLLQQISPVIRESNGFGDGKSSPTSTQPAPTSSSASGDYGAMNPAAPQQQINPATGQNVFNQSSMAYTSGINQMMNPTSIAQSMNQFINPYQNQVLDQALSRIRDRRNEDLNMVQTDAANASAFGGARHGLVEAELIDRYGRNEDELASRLLQQGFDTAAGYGSQQVGYDQANANALINAAPVGFNLGNAANQMQMQAGNQQQQLAQGVLSQAGSQYGAYASYPQTSLSTALAGLTGNPLAGNVNSTQSYNPGMFDYLSLGANTYAAGK